MPNTAQSSLFSGTQRSAEAWHYPLLPWVEESGSATKESVIFGVLKLSYMPTLKTAWLETSIESTRESLAIEIKELKSTQVNIKNSIIEM